MNEVNESATEQSGHSRVLDSVELKVKFDSGAPARSKVLYGNGRMQVKVQVLVSGYDENGGYVSVPADVMNTVELIHYNTGKTLRDGWNASTEQGRFTLEACASTDSMDASDHESEHQALRHVRTFWVSSTGVGTTQVAARISLNGTIIRSNATGLSGRQDSSVTLETQLPVTYSVDQFRWTSTRRGNEEPGNRIWNYYLGLYPQGQQIKLLDWSSSYGTDDVEFARGNKLCATNTNYLSGFLVRPEKKELSLSLPYDGGSIAYTFYSEAITTKAKHYVVRVNDREGELTVVQALSEYSNISQKSSADGIFNFSVYDQYGTEHKLAIRTDSAERSFSLVRG